MKKITKILVLLLAVAVLISAFAACEADNDRGDQEDTKADGNNNNADNDNNDNNNDNDNDNENDSNGDDTDNSTGDENETTPTEKDPNAVKLAYEAAGYVVSLNYADADGAVASLTAYKSTLDFANVYYYDTEAKAAEQLAEFQAIANGMSAANAAAEYIAYSKGCMACWGSSAAIGIIKNGGGNADNNGEALPADKDPNAAKAAYEAAGYTVSLTYVYTDGVIALLTAAKSTKDFANVYYFENEAKAIEQYTEFLKSTNEITSSSAPDDLVAYKSGTMACWGSSGAVGIMAQLCVD